MGKIKRNRQKLHLQTVKPSNSIKDKDDALKANEVEKVFLLTLMMIECKL